MSVRQMDRGRVLGHLRVRQRQTRGSRDPHVDTGAAMADETAVRDASYDFVCLFN